MDIDELPELLLDLKHDLGKHMLLPVAMLPAGAREPDLRAALARALRHTRPGRSAKQVWDAFLSELGDEAFCGRAEVEAAVARALAWEDRLDSPEAALDRAALLADLRAVGDTIGRALQRVGRDG